MFKLNFSKQYILVTQFMRYDDDDEKVSQVTRLLYRLFDTSAQRTLSAIEWMWQPRVDKQRNSSLFYCEKWTFQMTTDAADIASNLNGIVGPTKCLRKRFNSRDLPGGRGGRVISTFTGSKVLNNSYEWQLIL